jgi:hypothetical protein
MLIIGIALSILLGLTLLLAVSSKFTILEYLSFSFPLGIGLQTFLMSVLDWTNVGITRNTILIISIIAILGCLWPAYLHLKKDNDFLKKFSIEGCKLPKPNLVWILFMVLIVWFEGMNFYKTVFFPSFDTDSIRGFNFAGIAIAAEGTIKNLSLFTSPNFTFQTNAGLTSYTPFAQLAYAYVYLFGAMASKIINALMYLSFLGIFYSLLKRVTTHTAAAIFTFMMMITPEMLAFSALSGINVLHTVYASSGLIMAIIWFNRKDDEYLLVISALLLSMNCFARNEGIVFSATACLLVLYRTLRRDISWKKASLFFLTAFFGFLYWTLFLKANNIQSGGNLVITKLFWDAEKIDTIFRELKVLYSNTQYYGLSVVAFVLLLFLNSWNIIRKRDQLAAVLSTLGVMFLYTLIIYHIDYKWDSIENVLRYSYKRFFFSFIPLLWFYVASNHITRWFTQKADKLLYR